MTDELLQETHDAVIEIRGEVKRINGALERQRKDIEKNRNKADWNENKIYLFWGAAVALSAAVTFAVQYFV